MADFTPQLAEILSDAVENGQELAKKLAEFVDGEENRVIMLACVTLLVAIINHAPHPRSTAAGVGAMIQAGVIGFDA